MIFFIKKHSIQFIYLIFIVFYCHVLSNDLRGMNTHWTGIKNLKLKFICFSFSFSSLFIYLFILKKMTKKTFSILARKLFSLQSWSVWRYINHINSYEPHGYEKRYTWLHRLDKIYTYYFHSKIIFHSIFVL